MAKSRDQGYSVIMHMYWLVSLLMRTGCVTSNEVPVAVSRRSTGDVFFNSTNNTVRCSDGTGTYFVSERRCVRNEELFNGNMLLIVISSLLEYYRTIL